MTHKHEHALVSQTLRSGSDIVVASVNENPRYLAMVDTWFRYWLYLGRKRDPSIVPILLAFDVPIGRIDEKWSNYVVNLPTPNGVASTLAAQVSRIVWPASTIGDRNRIITTDIDMMPLSLRVIDAALAAPPDSFVVARNVLEDDLQFPICYCVAEARTWRKVFGNSSDFVEDLANVTKTIGTYDGVHGGKGWFSDQSLLHSKLTAWEIEGGTITRMTDAETGHRRLDRTSPMLRTFLSAPLAANQRWTDFHAYPPSRASRALNAWLLFWLKRSK